MKTPRGFTLIELLMAMLVMALLMAVVSATAEGGLRAFLKMREEVEHLRQVTLAMEQIRRDLTGAVYEDPATGSAIAGVNFVGLDAVDSGNPNDQIRFFAFTSPEGTARGDLASINYRREIVSTVPRLSRAMRGAAAAGLPALNLAGVETFEPLALDVIGFQATYLDTPGGTYQTDYDASTDGGLPRAVRITLTVRNPRGKDETFTQTVSLPLP